LAGLATANRAFDFIVAHGVYRICSRMPTNRVSSICTRSRPQSRSDRLNGPRQSACTLARLQTQSGDVVTTLLHVPVRIADTNALRVLPLVDGTRDRSVLASAVRNVARGIEPSRATDFVEFALEKFARLGLLMPTATAAG
jgi:protein-lysine methyltransferase-like protein